MDRYLPVWQKADNSLGIHYECGYCGVHTSPAKGYFTDSPGGHLRGVVLICTSCNRPTFHETVLDTILVSTPAARMGKEVAGLPSDVQQLYDETRQCTSAGAYTAAVLTCRKLLMHVAVEKGAAPDQQFIKYVEYLAAQNYVPKDGHDWVDHIRTKSNEANHEIQVMGKEDAEDLITFTEMLLRLVYEFKNRLSRRPGAQEQTPPAGYAETPKPKTPP